VTPAHDKPSKPGLRVAHVLTSASNNPRNATHGHTTDQAHGISHIFQILEPLWLRTEHHIPKFRERITRQRLGKGVRELVNRIDLHKLYILITNLLMEKAQPKLIVLSSFAPPQVVSQLNASLISLMKRLMCFFWLPYLPRSLHPRSD
jgi:hypothetical protein